MYLMYIPYGTCPERTSTNTPDPRSASPRLSVCQPVVVCLFEVSTELAVPDRGFVSVGAFSHLAQTRLTIFLHISARKQSQTGSGTAQNWAPIPCPGSAGASDRHSLALHHGRKPTLKFDVGHSQQTAASQAQSWAAKTANTRSRSNSRSFQRPSDSPQVPTVDSRARPDLRWPAVSCTQSTEIDRNSPQKRTPTARVSDAHAKGRSGSSKRKIIPRADATAPTAGCAIVARCCIGLCHRAALSSTEQH